MNETTVPVAITGENGEIVDVVRVDRPIALLVRALNAVVPGTKNYRIGTVGMPCIPGDCDRADCGNCQSGIGYVLLRNGIFLIAVNSDHTKFFAHIDSIPAKFVYPLRQDRHWRKHTTPREIWDMERPADYYQVGRGPVWKGDVKQIPDEDLNCPAINLFRRLEDRFTGCMYPGKQESYLRLALKYGYMEKLGCSPFALYRATEIHYTLRRLTPSLKLTALKVILDAHAQHPALNNPFTKIVKWLRNTFFFYYHLKRNPMYEGEETTQK